MTENNILIKISREEYKKFQKRKELKTPPEYDLLDTTISNIENPPYPSICCWNCEIRIKWKGFYLVKGDNGQYTVLGYFCGPLCCHTYLICHGLMNQHKTHFNQSLMWQNIKNLHYEKKDAPQFMLEKYGFGYMTSAEYSDKSGSD